MSRFLPLVTKKYEFEGDTITASFNRLTRKQMMAISPYIPANEEIEQTLEEQMKLINAAIDALKDNIKTFEGCKDSEGNALEFTDIADEAYFTNLLSEMATDLLNESMVQEKKSSTASEK